jgi:hypothetical protein
MRLPPRTHYCQHPWRHNPSFVPLGLLGLTSPRSCWFGHEDRRLLAIHCSYLTFFLQTFQSGTLSEGSHAHLALTYIVAATIVGCTLLLVFSLGRETRRAVSFMRLQKLEVCDWGSAIAASLS